MSPCVQLRADLQSTPLLLSLPVTVSVMLVIMKCGGPWWQVLELLEGGEIRQDRWAMPEEAAGDEEQPWWFDDLDDDSEEDEGEEFSTPSPSSSSSSTSN